METSKFFTIFPNLLPSQAHYTPPNLYMAMNKIRSTYHLSRNLPLVSLISTPPVRLLVHHLPSVSVSRSLSTKTATWGFLNGQQHTGFSGIKASPYIIHQITRGFHINGSESDESERESKYHYSRSMILSIGVISICGIFTIYNSSLLLNEARVYRKLFNDPSVLSNKNTILPDPSQDTFEMGLFSASQRELEQQEQQIRKSKTDEKFFGIFYKLKFFLMDYIWEPVITIGRFVELTCIFLPIVIFFPIQYFGKNNKKGIRSGSLYWFKIIRIAAEWAGASFIKLGQWAASRTDIFPNGLCEELSKLHSDAKAHSFRQTEKVLTRTFNGLTIEEVFDEFEKEPMGCGAIAQVYKAKLNRRFVKKDHEALVAVKVVHPNVEIKIERDLKIMRFFANVIDYIPTMEWLSLPQEVENFAILMKMQLDLRIEGNNLIRFRENFPAESEIKFPKPYVDISSRKILIEERINGLSMNRLLNLKEYREKGGISKEASDILIDSFLKMLILDNFIHADLHPGNAFIRLIKKNKKGDILSNDFETDELMERLNKIKDPQELALEFRKLHSEHYRPQLCLIDAGLVTELNEVNRFNFLSLFNALAEFDGYKAGELMIERSKTPGTAINKEVFKLKVERLVSRVKERTFTLGTISIGDLLDQMLSMVRSHHVRMEGDFITVIVAILLMEGIGRQLDSELDLFARSIPILRKIGFQEGKLILQDTDGLSMIKVWLTLEVRQFVNASIQDIYRLVKSDGLCPNY